MAVLSVDMSVPSRRPPLAYRPGRQTPGSAKASTGSRWTTVARLVLRTAVVIRVLGVSAFVSNRTSRAPRRP